MGPNFCHFWHQSGLQEASRTTWMTCCIKTPIFKRKLASRDRSGHEKSSKTIGGVSKIRVFAFACKVALGRGLGTLFGTILRFKLEPSWTKLGPCWNIKANTKQQQRNMKNLIRFWLLKIAEEGKRSLGLQGPAAGGEPI